MTMLAFLLDVAGFVLLGLASDRQHRALFAIRPDRGRALALRVPAWLLLAAAVAVAFLGQGGVLGSVVAAALLMAGAASAFLILHLATEKTIKHR